MSAFAIAVNVPAWCNLTRMRRGLSSALLLWCLAPGCAVKERAPLSGESSQGSAGSAPASAEAANMGPVFIDSTSVDGGVGRDTCLAEVRGAERIPLDIYVMLDRSESMLEPTPSGATKWEAIRNAIWEFVEDPGSADIGIGLQYFPHFTEGAPEDLVCSSNADCGGSSGPCDNTYCVTQETGVSAQPGSAPFEYFVAAGENAPNCSTNDDCDSASDLCKRVEGVCVNNGFQLNQDNYFLLCETGADCPPGARCEELGLCEISYEIGEQVPCTPSVQCFPGEGECLGIANFCANGTVCDAAEYAAPEVAISSGAERNDALLVSLTSLAPEGLTPTGPALDGALRHAQAWAQSMPAHEVVTVLATDGFPTECAPTALPEVAAIARAGTEGERSIRTFVIGVFGAADLADDGQANLDSIAVAGGTSNAFIVDTQGDVNAQFLEALNAIRARAVSCEFQLPAPTAAGASLDLNAVNLQFTTAGEVRQLARVDGPDACANAPGQGWFYELDAASGVATQIRVCPDVCSDFEQSSNGQLDVQIGCETIVR